MEDSPAPPRAPAEDDGAGPDEHLAYDDEVLDPAA
jgi:hypothetical protein